MAESVTIKAIEARSIHQIQSGQVIVDLCSVAKELVENSIDAGATSIDVRFKNQGLDAIEVQDNGAGISAPNYESVARKHHTSKLSSYDDLGTLQTFGFRGEALSSLCALSNFVVVTCTQQDVPKARKLEFETSGELKSTSVVSGQRGTTVIVEDLFRNLPVRRRELERNIKREWTKVIGLLNQYACVQTGIKFTVSQQPNKGRRMVLFTTKGNPTTRENIINVFGVKTMNALISLDLRFELESTGAPGVKWTSQHDGGSSEISVRGHISRPSHGEGRQAPDRQMFYVNGRPCGLPQFAKVFNEVYRSYNSNQSPFIFADIQLDTHLYDVNVSPDKRTILLHDQGKMLDNLKESLIELFETQDVTIPTASYKKTPLKNSTTPSSGFKTPGLDSVRSTGSARSSRQRSGTKPESADDELSGEEDEPEDDGPPSGQGQMEEARPTPESRARGDRKSDLLDRWVSRKAVIIPEVTVRESPGYSGTRSTNGEKAQQEQPEDEDEASDNDRPSRQENRLSGFQARLAALKNGSGQVELREKPEQADLESEMDEQTPIPSIPPPSQPSPPKSTFKSPIRPLKRSTQDVVTVTIGDETITNLFGAASKRPRVSQLPTRSSPKKTQVTGAQAARPVPSFGGRLSQMFSASATGEQAAPGIQYSASLVNALASRVSRDSRDSSDEDDREEVDELSDGEGTSQEKEPSLRAEDDHSEEDTLFVTGDAPDEIDVDEPSIEDVEPDEEKEEEAGRSQLDPTDEAETRSIELEEESGDESQVEDDERKADTDYQASMVEAVGAMTSEATEESAKRSQMLVKGKPKRKDVTANLEQRVKMDEDSLRTQMEKWTNSVRKSSPASGAYNHESEGNGLDADEEAAEARLSLKITKSDFQTMRIVGQFNLGFVLAVREAAATVGDDPASDTPADDELFIIDQHASDEKYNFERLQASTVVQSQRLVQPKTLELTAMEEEIIMENLPALERNGFNVQVDDTGEVPVGSRCRLLSLPLSRETTFSLEDLEELLFLLAENPTSSATTVPRPSKVRKMFAMRACRSSIMIGRALSQQQMEKVVRHMGEMEKPWNCPHGRPTMRHLCGLRASEARGWSEDTHDGEHAPNWMAWARTRKAEREA